MGFNSGFKGLSLFTDHWNVPETFIQDMCDRELLRYTEANFWHNMNCNGPLGKLTDGQFVNKLISL